MDFVCRECECCRTGLEVKDISEDRFAVDVLYLHDEIVFLDVLSSVIRKHFRKFYTTSTTRDAFEIFRVHRPQIMVFDKYWLNKDDISLIDAVRKLDTDCSIVLITALYLPELRDLRDAVTKFMAKPVSVVHFLGVMKCMSQSLASQGKEPLFASEGGG